MELYRMRFGILSQEVQADKLYLEKKKESISRLAMSTATIVLWADPQRKENDLHADDKKRAIGERNEIEATFGTSKRVYRANDIRAKLDDTADTWIGACFFAKNAIKFLRDFFVSFSQNGVLRLSKTKLSALSIIPQKA